MQKSRLDLTTMLSECQKDNRVLCSSCPTEQISSYDNPCVLSILEPRYLLTNCLNRIKNFIFVLTWQAFWSFKLKSYLSLFVRYLKLYANEADCRWMKQRQQRFADIITRASCGTRVIILASLFFFPSWDAKHSLASKAHAFI